MLVHVDLMAPGQSYAVLPHLSRVTNGMPPRYSTDFMRKLVIMNARVARTRVVGQSRIARSDGVLPTSGDQLADVFLQVPTLY